MQNVLAHSQTAVFQPSGHINASNADTLENQLVTAISSGEYSTVVADMSHVESLDSAGLMALVSALNLAQRSGQEFFLCCVPPSIRIIFELTQLNQAFDVLDERPALAVAA